ncbi:hypothetical protein ACPF35_003461 [Vibrio cholerae]
MKKIILIPLASIFIFSCAVGYQFTETSIQSRANDVALNSDSCLFFSYSSEFGEKTVIYCSDRNSLGVVKGSTLGVASTPIISNETLKGLGDIVVFETFKMKDIESVSVKLYQYGYLFELKPKDNFDISGYSIAVKRAEIGALYR